MACKKASTYFPASIAKMLPDNCLHGKVAFITGGGTGLGQAMATTIASLGASVVIASRRLPLLEDVAAKISAQTGAKVLPVQMNVRDPIDIAKAADFVEHSFGLPDIVINNAAGNFISPTERLSSNAFRTIVDTVLMGTANVCLEFGKRLIKAEKGAAFLAITTPYARSGSGFVSPSAASKAGVENLTKSLASEWARYGMRFNCIAPGPIETEGAFSRLDPTGEGVKRTMQRIPCGRTGKPEELANLASYVVSDFASWMNGSIIDFDGGESSMLAGTFNMLHQIQPEQWDMLEKQIRKTNKESKSKAKL